MSYFLKLNLVSIYYGLMFFISIELQVNYYRMLRLTGWEGQQIDIFLSSFSRRLPPQQVVR